jgi:hypothetical protein
MRAKDKQDETLEPAPGPGVDVGPTPPGLGLHLQQSGFDRDGAVEPPSKRRQLQHEFALENRARIVERLTSDQIRAGRTLVRWSADELARASRVGVATIRRAELAERETSMTAPNDMAIRQALEEVGIEFIDENGGGPGVRLRKRQEKRG